MTILHDMNMSPRWLAALEAANIAAIHWSQIGAPAAPDREIMDYAREHDYIVLTHDLDFSAILALDLVGSIEDIAQSWSHALQRPTYGLC